MSTQHSRLLILGSGPAGYTAAVYAARANLKPVLITGLAQGGQLMTTTDVDNWPADADGVQGPELMARFQKHAERFETEIIFDQIHTAKLAAKPIRLHRRQRRIHLRRADHRDRRLGALSRPAVGAGVHGQGRVGLRDVRRVLLQGAGRGGVGGGNTAVEEALYLSNIASTVTLVHRRDKFRAEAILIDKLMAKTRHGGNIRVVWNHTLDEVLGEPPASRARGSRTSGPGATQDRAAMGMFIAIGHTPNTGIFEGQLDMNGGYIKVRSGTDGNATATSVPGVFAAGDVADHVYRQAVTSAGTGCMAALDAEAYLEVHG